MDSRKFFNFNVFTKRKKEIPDPNPEESKSTSSSPVSESNTTLLNRRSVSATNVNSNRNSMYGSLPRSPSRTKLDRKSSYQHISPKTDNYLLPTIETVDKAIKNELKSDDSNDPQFHNLCKNIQDYLQTLGQNKLDPQSLLEITDASFAIINAIKNYKGPNDVHLFPSFIAAKIRTCSIGELLEYNLLKTDKDHHYQNACHLAVKFYSNYIVHAAEDTEHEAQLAAYTILFFKTLRDFALSDKQIENVLSFLGAKLMKYNSLSSLINSNLLLHIISPKASINDEKLAWHFFEFCLKINLAPEENREKATVDASVNFLTQLNAIYLPQNRVEEIESVIEEILKGNSKKFLNAEKIDFNYLCAHQISLTFCDDFKCAKIKSDFTKAFENCLVKLNRLYLTEKQLAEFKKGITHFIKHSKKDNIDQLLPDYQKRLNELTTFEKVTIPFGKDDIAGEWKGYFGKVNKVILQPKNPAIETLKARQIIRKSKKTKKKDKDKKNKDKQKSEYVVAVKSLLPFDHDALVKNAKMMDADNYKDSIVEGEAKYQFNLNSFALERQIAYVLTKEACRIIAESESNVDLISQSHRLNVSYGISAKDKDGNDISVSPFAKLGSGVDYWKNVPKSIFPPIDETQKIDLSKEKSVIELQTEQINLITLLPFKFLDSMQDICSGVALLHRKYVIHGDISLKNVLYDIVNDQTIPQITDYGLSQFLPDIFDFNAKIKVNPLCQKGYSDMERSGLHHMSFASDVFALRMVYVAKLATAAGAKEAKGMNGQRLLDKDGKPKYIPIIDIEQIFKTINYEDFVHAENPNQEIFNFVTDKLHGILLTELNAAHGDAARYHIALLDFMLDGNIDIKNLDEKTKATAFDLRKLTSWSTTKKNYIQKEEVPILNSEQLMLYIQELTDAENLLKKLGKEGIKNAVLAHQRHMKEEIAETERKNLELSEREKENEPKELKEEEQKLEKVEQDQEKELDLYAQTNHEMAEKKTEEGSASTNNELKKKPKLKPIFKPTTTSHSLPASPKAPRYRSRSYGKTTTSPMAPTPPLRNRKKILLDPSQISNEIEDAASSMGSSRTSLTPNTSEQDITNATKKMTDHEMFLELNKRLVKAAEEAASEEASLAIKEREHDTEENKLKSRFLAGRAKFGMVPRVSSFDNLANFKANKQEKKRFSLLSDFSEESFGEKDINVTEAKLDSLDDSNLNLDVLIEYINLQTETNENPHFLLEKLDDKIKNYLELCGGYAKLSIEDVDFNVEEDQVTIRLYPRYGNEWMLSNDLASKVYQPAKVELKLTEAECKVMLKDTDPMSNDNHLSIRPNN